MDARVWALAWGPDDALYAGGEFTSAGGVSGADRIARWTTDGDWSAVGTGLNGRVRTLSWGPDGALYAGGGFTTAGNTSGANHLAQWHPSAEGVGAWRALGTGTNNGVLALDWGPDALLHVGGLFTTADGAPSAYLGRWKSSTDVSNEPGPTSERFAITSVHPNPFRGAATVTLAVPEASSVRIELYDMLGRLVLNVADGSFSAGVHEIALSSNGLAPAIYLVRLTGPDYAETRRITVVR